MRTLITFLFLSTIVFGQLPNAWINEFHYENDGASDVGEFVEVAIENVQLFDKSKLRFCTYNGYNGKKSSNYFNLTEFVEGTTENNITLYYVYIDGIQNGDPDGLCIDYDGNVLQFLSYEGVFSAVDGVAIGLTSTDIGVSESSSTPVGSSLGLTGNGTDYNSFTWTTFATATPGQPNGNQVLPVELTLFTASFLDNKVKLNWETATEVNNYGFNVERRLETGDWNKVGFVEGYGNSNSPKFYNFIDRTLSYAGKYSYRLKQIDIDGKFEYSDEVEINFGTPNNYKLNQNYPNPFNPTTKIEFTIPVDAKVRLCVFNILGEEVSVIVNQNLAAGFYSFNFDASKLNAGIYFYKLESGNFHQIKKMIFLK